MSILSRLKVPSFGAGGVPDLDEANYEVNSGIRRSITGGEVLDF